MSILTTLTKDGLSAAFKLIPTPYILGIIGAAAVGLFIWGKIWLHNKVETEAQVIVNKYIAQKAKDDAELAQIDLKDNTKIQIQYIHDTQTVTKTVVVNHDVIIHDVPDTKTILSDGWVSAYNDSVIGLMINPVSAAVATPSGVSAVDALEVINDNNGACAANLIELTALQQWVNDTKAAVAAQNHRDHVK